MAGTPTPKSDSRPIARFVDNRAEAQHQRQLQHLADKSAVVRQQKADWPAPKTGSTVQRAEHYPTEVGLSPAAPSHGKVIQREKWQFTDNGWRSMDQPDRSLTPDNDQHDAIEKIGLYNASHGRVQSTIGDIYDDETGQMFTSDNLSMVKTGSFGLGDMSAREARMRAAFSHSKAILSKAINLIGSVLEEEGAFNGNARLKHALNMSFPFTQHLDAAALVARGGVLANIYKVASRISAGLSSPKAVIRMLGGFGLSMGSMASPFTKGAKGFVLATPREAYEHGVQAPYTDLWQMYGDIHVAAGSEEPWTIIHEAAHKFAGAEDIQYSSRSSELTREDELERLRGTEIPQEIIGMQETAEYGRRRAAAEENAYEPIEDTTGSDQQVWYRMGRRALKNADSYAYFIMMLGAPSLRIPHGPNH